MLSPELDGVPWMLSGLPVSAPADFPSAVLQWTKVRLENQWTLRSSEVNPAPILRCLWADTQRGNIAAEEFFV